MRGAVVYYSRWGNCEQVAHKVAEGLREAGHEVVLLDAKIHPGLERDLDFLVAGSPTRAGKSAGPIRKFLNRTVTDAWDGKPFGAFGTALRRSMEQGDKQSADDLRSLLLAKGLEPAAPVFKAAVEGMKGPLGDRELERALEFGRELGKQLSKEQEQ